MDREAVGRSLEETDAGLRPGPGSERRGLARQDAEVPGNGQPCALRLPPACT